MSRPASAASLLQALDLLADGPVLWGQPVRSRAPGIFLVEVASRTESAPIDITAVRAWVERVPGLRVDGRPPTPGELAARLASFWLPGQTVLYVGRTNKSLGARTAAMFQTPLGDRRPHPGGHWLRTLQDVGALRVWWAETEAPEEYEDAVVSALADELTPEQRAALPPASPVLPWANLETVTGERKATGISGPVLAEGEMPATPDPRPSTSSARPSRAAGAATRRTAVSRGTAARPVGGPRATAATNRASSRTTRTSGPPAPAATHVTAAGLEALELELEDLRVVRRPEVILRVKNARELGDLRENADYEAARNEQSFLEGRIQSLEQMLKTAVVIASDDTGAVALGSTVVADVEDERITLAIVGSTEADPAAGRISNVSPVGKALLGRRAGDEVVITTPGREMRYRIIEVRAT